MVVVISAKREKHGVLRGEAGVGEDNRRGGGWVERGEGLLLCEEVRWSGEERGGGILGAEIHRGLVSSSSSPSSCSRRRRQYLCDLLREKARLCPSASGVRAISSNWK